MIFARFTYKKVLVTIPATIPNPTTVGYAAEATFQEIVLPYHA